ncbi:pyridoxal phosphate-dependent decarboxylase family protein [Corynebacterium tapiri]|uniref:Aspartate aminotransferase family protein n=1 Tax=Corynebacterium tapiri TaxID=1448266 RepID=A0A5C4U4P1_9CORY|nr:aminotransferase class V-fold PLP-dependent enzyme [Corynebacterium tapiri]TNL98546.1 aspartate aminotransferase family protein [Corynebacterium tapiri]
MLEPSPTDEVDDLVLLGRHPNPQRLRKLLHTAVDTALDHLEGAETPSSSARPLLPHTPPTPEEALESFGREWLGQAVWYHHPRYLAHLNCPVSALGVAADIMATIANTAVESFDQAGVAAEAEVNVLRTLGQLVGWNDASGTFTSGGSQSNLQALAIVRQASPRKDILITANTHYSVSRAAALFGLRTHLVPTDAFGRMDPQAARELIATLEDSPAAIIATAGTTDRGSIDDLEALADLAEDHRAHLHVDAAYGGALLCNAETSGALRGIERAASVTLDMHKGFFQPVPCSALVVPDPQTLAAIRINASYLNPAESERPNLADNSLQTTRRFDAAKIFLSLSTYGAEAIGSAFARCMSHAGAIAEAIERHPTLELYETPQLSTVIFRPRGVSSDELEQLKMSLFDAGDAVVATTTVAEERWLKFTILDPYLTLDEVSPVLDRIAALANTKELSYL